MANPDPLLWTGSSAVIARLLHALDDPGGRREVQPTFGLRNRNNWEAALW